MDNGEEQDFRKDDAMMLPSGHDAWAVGEELGVFVKFSRSNDY
jgi:hypothetical protein